MKVALIISDQGNIYFPARKKTNLSQDTHVRFHVMGGALRDVSLHQEPLSQVAYVIGDNLLHRQLDRLP
jgi:hypothetical protein